MTIAVDQLKEVLADSSKAIRLGIFNGQNHKEVTAFTDWDNREVGTSMGVLCAYQQMIQNIDKPLSRNIIDNMRSQFFQDGNIYGNIENIEDLKKLHREFNDEYSSIFLL